MKSVNEKLCFHQILREQDQIKNSHVCTVLAMPNPGFDQLRTDNKSPSTTTIDAYTLQEVLMYIFCDRWAMVFQKGSGFGAA
jgi:hypothetical protein